MTVTVQRWKAVMLISVATTPACPTIPHASATQVWPVLMSSPKILVATLVAAKAAAARDHH
jgi:hypothetical protein